MADVPVEAVEFARMAVRAFYPIEYAVIADGVLRRNNFCSHADLSYSLRMQPKELRQILTRMVGARLMRSDKLQQKRVNYKDEKRPSRIVHTEFWYVPLPELIDAFQFRVDKISRELDEKIQKESEQDLHKCQSCGARYKLVDIVGNADPESNMFVCHAITLTRRDCGGVILEEDNSSRLKETENFKRRFEEELQPLRALASRCNGVKIPNHPLEGADKATWDLYVPETIGLRGEVVDAEGLNSELAAEVNGRPLETAIVDFKASAGGSLGGSASAIPERPDWFKSGSKGDDDDDDDWEDTEEAAAGSAAKAGPAFGTGAMFGAGSEADAKSYMESYMKTMGGEAKAEPEDVREEPKEEDGGGTVANGSPDSADVDGGEPGLDVDLQKAQNEQSTDIAGETGVGTEADPTPADEEDPALDALVTVKGESYRMRDITQDLIEQMTQDEFKRYCEQRQVGEDDDDDGSVEFE